MANLNGQHRRCVQNAQGARERSLKRLCYEEAPPLTISGDATERKDKATAPAIASTSTNVAWAFFFMAFIISFFGGVLQLDFAANWGSAELTKQMPIGYGP